MNDSMNLQLVNSAFKVIVESYIQPEFTKELVKSRRKLENATELIINLNNGQLTLCYTCFNDLECNSMCLYCYIRECVECVKNRDKKPFIIKCNSCKYGICEKCSDFKPHSELNYCSQCGAKY
jgi:hypothetical protein